MEPTWHPPLAVARHVTVSGEPPRRCAYGHVRLWIRLEIEPWGVVRAGHLHLVQDLERGGPLTAVELARHPLVVVPDLREPEGLREALTAGVRVWLESWRPTFWRLPGLDLVSELGETGEAFCRRVRAMLQPELQRQVDRLQERPLPRLPWRRRAEQRRRRAARDELAEALARVTAGLESWTDEAAAGGVRSLEGGLLVAGDDLLRSSRNGEPTR